VFHVDIQVRFFADHSEGWIDHIGRYDTVFELTVAMLFLESRDYGGLSAGAQVFIPMKKIPPGKSVIRA
jgi:hypothetical protein